jgi:phage-related protein
MSKIGIAVTAFGIIGGAIIPIIAGLSEFIPVILAIGVVMVPIIVSIMAMGAAFTYILVKAGALDVISVLFKGMVNGIKQGITTFKGVLKAGGDPVTAFTTALKRIVPPELIPVVKALETALAPLKQGIITFNGVIKAGGNPITAFTTALKRILPPEVLGLLTPLQPIIDRLSFSFGKFTSMVKAGASPIFALKVMIKDWIPPQTIKLIENLASTFIKLIESGVKYAIKYFNLILIVVKDVMSVLQPFGEKLIKSIIPPLLQIASQIQEFGTIFFKTMSEKLSIVIAIWKAMFPWLKLIIVPILDAVITIIKNLFNQLKNIFDVALGILTGDWSRVWKGLKNIVKDGLSTVTGVITTMLDGIGRLFVELASKAITWGGNIISGIIDGITGMVGKLKDTVSGIATAIKDFFPNSPAKTGALTTLPSWGRNISSMLAEGMLANKSKVATAAGAVSKIISKYLGWHSPTELGAGSDSDKWAPNLMKMFTAGLKKAIPGVSAACKAITDAISDKFYKAPTSIQKFFDDVRTTINDNVTSLKDVAKGKLNDLASAVTDALKNKSQGEYDKASQSTQWSIDAAEKAYAAYELQLNNEAEARYAAGSDARAFEDELIKARLADKKNELDKLKAMQEIELAQLKRDYDEKQKQAEDFDTINYYMMDNHQNDLITLLISYNSDWYKAGMSFADKLIAGFTSNDPAYYIKAILTNTVKTISSTFEDTMSISASSIESQVDEIQNKMQAGVDKMKANSTSYKSISTGTASTQSKIDALNKQIAALKKKTTTTTTTKGTGSDLGLSQYNDLIAKASKTYGVPEALIRAVMKQESGGNAKAVSSAGAQGLMQLMPGTARGLGVTNSFDPTQNVMGGTKYLSQMLSQFGGNTNKAIQAYNAGPAGNFNNSETQNYLKMVTGYMQQAGGSSNNTTTKTNTAVVKQIKDLQAQVANYKSQITKSPSTLASLVKANEAIGAQLGLVKSNGSWFIPGQSTALFAKGGIVTRPTNAIIGEGNEPEGVFPLSKLEKFITISQQSGLSPSVIINNDGLFRGANLTIRDDRDIRKLADEVSKQMQKTKNSRVRGGL